MNEVMVEPTVDRRVPPQVLALGYRDYRWFWGASIVSNTGSMMHMAAVNWVVADLHGVTTATVITGIGLIPMVLSSPIGGALADRYERRLVFLGAVVLQLLTAGALALAYTVGWTSVATFVVLSIVGGFTSSVGAPVQQAIIPDLVPISAIRNASVLNSTQFTVCRALGPTLAGLLIGAFGASIVFWANTASFGALIVVLRRMHRRPPRPRAENPESNVAAFWSGCRYAFGHPALRLTMVTGSVLAFVTAPLQMNGQVVAREAFDAGPTAFGLLVGAFGYGSLLAAIGMVVLDRGWRPRMLVAVGLLTLVVALLGLAVAPSVAVGIVANAFIGVAFMLAMSTIVSALHAACDDAFRGRVMSLWMILWGTAAPLGIMLTGLAAVVGIRWVLAIDALLVAVFLAHAHVRGRLHLLDT